MTTRVSAELKEQTEREEERRSNWRYRAQEKMSVTTMQPARSYFSFSMLSIRLCQKKRETKTKVVLVESLKRLARLFDFIRNQLICLRPFPPGQRYFHLSNVKREAFRWIVRKTERAREINSDRLRRVSTVSPDVSRRDELYGSRSTRYPTLR